MISQLLLYKVLSIYYTLLYQDWKDETTTMKALLEESKAAANNMTLHDDADRQYAGFVTRWEVVNKTADGWIEKMKGLVAMWEKQEGIFTNDYVTPDIGETIGISIFHCLNTNTP